VLIALFCNDASVVQTGRNDRKRWTTKDFEEKGHTVAFNNCVPQMLFLVTYFNES